MIKVLNDLTNQQSKQVMEIWLQSNLDSHKFVPKDYWYQNAFYVEKALATSKIIVYEKDDNIIGFMGIVENYIAGIFVDKNQRGKGIGSVLLDTAKEIYTNLSLDVYEKNERAILFYEKHDFKKVKKHFDDENNEFEILMHWKNA